MFQKLFSALLCVSASYHCRPIACVFTCHHLDVLAVIVIVDFSHPLPVPADLITICADARNRMKGIVSESFCCESLTFGPIGRVLDTLV